MTVQHSSVSNSCRLAISIFLSLTLSNVGAQQLRFSTSHRNSEHVLPQSVTGGNTKLRSQLASAGQGISLAVADFNSDGTGDLVSGYAVGSEGVLLLQAGNGHALAPTSAELQAIATGQSVVPFAARSEIVRLPVPPDLLKTADIAGHGHSDLLIAAKGDTNVYLLRGDGKGHFAAPKALPLSGAVSALAIWRGPEGTNLIAAGVCATGGCGIQMLAADGTAKGFVPTSGTIAGIEVAPLNYGPYADVAVLTANGVSIFDGASLLSGAPQRAPIPVSGATAIATGLFAYDSRAFAQIAVLGADATLHVFARAGVQNGTPTLAEIAAARQAIGSSNSHTPKGPSAASLAWTEVETVSNVGPGGSSAVMLRGRFSGGGFDDLAVMAGGQYVTVAHPITSDGTLRSTTPLVTVDATTSGVIAAVAARVSPDARLGVVTATRAIQPLYTIPPASRTMTVNTTADAVVTTAAMNACKNGTAGCTLRAAIAVVNADAASNGSGHVDTVNIPAGTYAITANNGSTVDAYGSFNYHFDIDGSANFVGAGSGSTIINAAQIDKVFSVNSGVVNGFAPYDVFFSGMTIENGENKNNPNSGQCGGGCDYYGGNIDWDSAGPGTLGFSNVTLTGGKIDYGSGGGLLASNVTTGASSASGLTEFDNSTISNNSTAESGGGIETSDLVPVILSSVIVSGNTANPSVNASDSGKTGQGGGVFIEADPNETSSTAITITNSTFSNNAAYDSGGGAHFFGSSPVISGTTFTNNTAGVYGGAVYLDTPDITHATSITTSTFTGNSVTNNQAGTYSGSPYPSNGGAICVETGPSNLVTQIGIHYSRFHSNTSSASGSATGVGVGCQAKSGAGYANVNATDNWWGCNGAGAGTGCDSALNYFPSTATLTLTPYTNLILNLTSTTPAASSSFTATGSLGQDSAGTVYTQATDLAYIGVPATLAIVQNGGGTTNSSATTLTATAAPATSFAAITTTATANSSGAGTATVTVDGFAVSKSFTVTASDLTVTSTHVGNFKAGDTADTYTLTVSNIGNLSTSGTVTLVDTLPSGFTAVSLSGTGWTCSSVTLTCTRSDALTASSSYAAITLTVSVSGSIAGPYTNSVTVSGGGEAATSNDTGTDSTIVVGQPTISEAFLPTTVAPNANSTVTFTLGNPSANSVSLTGVAFTDTLPSGLKVSTPNGAATTCTGGTVTAAAGGSSIALSGATIAAGATCTVTVNVNSPTVGGYTNTTGTVTATNSNAGGTASATLAVSVTPTRLVYTARHLPRSPQAETPAPSSWPSRTP